MNGTAEGFFLKTFVESVSKPFGVLVAVVEEDIEA